MTCKGYLEDAWNFVESRIKTDTLRNPSGFDCWWKMHKAFMSQMPHHSDSGSVEGPKGQFKCFDIRCQHYAYGFETVEDQERHLKAHQHSRLSPGPATLMRSVSNPMKWRHSGELWDVNAVDDDNPCSSPEAGSPIFQLPPNRQERSVAPTTSSKSTSLARRRASPIGVSNPSPCQRCKILKKGVSKIYCS